MLSQTQMCAMPTHVKIGASVHVPNRNTTLAQITHTHTTPHKYLSVLFVNEQRKQTKTYAYYKPTSSPTHKEFKHLTHTTLPKVNTIQETKQHPDIKLDTYLH